MKTTTSWLDQWLDADAYPARPLSYRHIFNITQNVPGGLDEVVEAVAARGWTAISNGRHIIILKDRSIVLLTGSLEILR